MEGESSSIEQQEHEPMDVDEVVTITAAEEESAEEVVTVVERKLPPQYCRPGGGRLSDLSEEVKCQLPFYEVIQTLNTSLNGSRLIWIEKDSNGGAWILRAHKEEINTFSAFEKHFFVDEFLKMLFSEDEDSQPYFAMGVIHEETKAIPNLLDLLSELKSEMQINVGSLDSNSKTQTSTINEYKAKVLENYSEGTFLHGPLQNFNLCRNDVGERSGEYFPEVLEFLEGSEFLKRVVPWGDLAVGHGGKRHTSEDGVYLSIRPGEQLVPMKQIRTIDAYFETEIKQNKDAVEWTLYEDRDNAHYDYVWDGLHKLPVAVVGVQQAVHYGESGGFNRRTKDVVAFHAPDFDKLVSKLNLEVDEVPNSQCVDWLDDGRLNYLRKQGIRYSKVQLYDNDVYFIPRNVVHQIQTISATCTIGWQVRLKQYYPMPVLEPEAPIVITLREPVDSNVIGIDLQSFCNSRGSLKEYFPKVSKINLSLSPPIDVGEERKKKKKKRKRSSQSSEIKKEPAASSSNNHKDKIDKEAYHRSSSSSSSVDKEAYHRSSHRSDKSSSSSSSSSSLKKERSKERSRHSPSSIISSAVAGPSKPLEKKIVTIPSPTKCKTVVNKYKNFSKSCGLPQKISRPKFSGFPALSTKEPKKEEEEGEKSQSKIPIPPRIKIPKKVIKTEQELKKEKEELMRRDSAKLIQATCSKPQQGQQIPQSSEILQKFGFVIPKLSKKVVVAEPKVKVPEPKKVEVPKVAEFSEDGLFKKPFPVMMPKTPVVAAKPKTAFPVSGGQDDLFKDPVLLIRSPTLPETLKHLHLGQQSQGDRLLMRSPIPLGMSSMDSRKRKVIEEEGTGTSNSKKPRAEVKGQSQPKEGGEVKGQKEDREVKGHENKSKAMQLTSSLPRMQLQRRSISPQERIVPRKNYEDKKSSSAGPNEVILKKKDSDTRIVRKISQATGKPDLISGILSQMGSLKKSSTENT